MGILKGILGHRSGKKNYSKDIGVPIAGDMVEFCLVASEDANCAILIGLTIFRIPGRRFSTISIVNLDMTMMR